MKSEISWAWGCRPVILVLGSPRQEEPESGWPTPTVSKQNNTGEKETSSCQST